MELKVVCLNPDVVQGDLGLVETHNSNIQYFINSKEYVPGKFFLTCKSGICADLCKSVICPDVCKSGICADVGKSVICPDVCKARFVLMCVSPEFVLMCASPNYKPILQTKNTHT